MTIPIDPKKLPINSSNITQNFEKYCVKCGQGLYSDSQFCSKCGTKVINDVSEVDSLDIEDEINENVCSECGNELMENAKFCPKCGARIH